MGRLTRTTTAVAAGALAIVLAGCGDGQLTASAQRAAPATAGAAAAAASTQVAPASALTSAGAQPSAAPASSVAPAPAPAAASSAAPAQTAATTAATVAPASGATVTVSSTSGPFCQNTIVNGIEIKHCVDGNNNTVNVGGSATNTTSAPTGAAVTVAAVGGSCLPATFPLPPGASVTACGDDGQLVGAALAVPNGADAFKFWTAALPAAGYQITYTNSAVVNGIFDGEIDFSGGGFSAQAGTQIGIAGNIVGIELNRS